jgi:hypothetical protein
MNINTDTTPADNFVELKAISQIHFLRFKEYHKEEFLEEKYSQYGLSSFITFHTYMYPAKTQIETLPIWYRVISA